ncbi:MAG: hypothetical protein U0074_00100 [Kouleothrix sp.]
MRKKIGARAGKDCKHRSNQIIERLHRASPIKISSSAITLRFITLVLIEQCPANYILKGIRRQHHQRAKRYNRTDHQQNGAKHLIVIAALVVDRHKARNRAISQT